MRRKLECEYALQTRQVEDSQLFPGLDGQVGNRLSYSPKAQVRQRSTWRGLDTVAEIDVVGCP